LDAALAQIVLHAQPRRRHFRDSGKPQTREIGKLEAGMVTPADQIEWVARDDFAEARQRRRLLLARLHHAHRAAPSDVNSGVEETSDALARTRRADQFDIE